jgi:hypothetical protein
VEKKLVTDTQRLFHFFETNVSTRHGNNDMSLEVIPNSDMSLEFIPNNYVSAGHSK